MMKNCVNADSCGYSGRELKLLERLVVEHEKEIEKAWNKHIGGGGAGRDKKRAVVSGK